MHPSITTKVESARGCGYRKPGAFYMVSDGLSAPCGKLPLLLNVCPACGGGIHPARGWTWVQPNLLFKDAVCALKKCPNACVLKRPPARAGLLWVGTKFYETPSAFTSEAARLGVSRRISRLPRDFVVGETWVLLGHRQAVTMHCPEGCHLNGSRPCDACGGTGMIHLPGIFTAFRPSRVEYVIKGDETDEQIEDLLKRGFSPVQVIRDTDYRPLFDTEVANGVS